MATNGNDAWSGALAAPTPTKTDGPFRSLERARDQVRSLKTAGALPARALTIVVRGGVYPRPDSFTLEARDSGTPSAPVVYRAAPGEQVILAGGPVVPAAAFQVVTDAAILARLDPAARDRVRQADLLALGVADLRRFPKRYEGAPLAPELFCNGRRMTLARWPNDRWAEIARIIDPGSDYHGTRGGVFEYAGDRPARWNVAAGVWLHGYWAFDWHAEVIQVQAIDPATRQIALADRAVYSIKQGNPAPRRWYALNLLEELDSPGEYYIDQPTGMLYFWPPAPLAGARVALSTVPAPLISIRNATNIIVRGFQIEASLEDGIEITGGHEVRIQACQIANTRRLGVRVVGGTSNQVEACDIHDTGTGGILLAGGDRRTLAPGAHQAVNNHIWRFASHKLTYSSAVKLEGVGHRVAHNLVHDAPHQAIGIDGNDHLFEYNIVHHVCLETDDCGALYKGRNPSCRGNVIRYNFWHHIGRPDGHGNAAVYFDDGDGGDRVVGNVFYRCGYPVRGSFGAVFSHGGHDNLAENNIFIECGRALGSAPWNDERWRAALLSDRGEGWNWQDKLLRQVDITRPPYTTRYPELIGFLDPPPGQLRRNRAVRNLIVDCADVASGNWQVSTNENLVVTGDPGFVDARRGDFRLRPRSTVFARLPAFQPIPFAKIGPYADDLRPRPPREPWTD